MIGNVELKEDGTILTPGTAVSLYQPSDEVRNITAAIQTDYQTGHNIMTDSYREFNDMNVFNRQDRDQKAFNTYVSPPSEDPDEEWRYNGVRPLSRNKAMVMAAHVTARLLYGNVDAQNDKDESDKIWATAMKDMVLWNIENSDYEMSYFFSVIAALVNPCSWVKQDFVEATQKIRVELEDGTIEIKEAIDNVMSGMNFFNIPVDEMLISNIREYEVQRQRFLIRRRFIDFQEAKAKWGHNQNFEDFVKPGVKTFFNDQDGLFYEQKDDQLQNHLVEEVTYYNRQEDMEIPFVSSIYLGDDEVENNPIMHRDNEGKPRYQYVKFGFSPIDERQFFYYKSLMFSLENEQDLLDIMTRLVVDGAILDVNSPLAVIGGDRIDSSVMFPSAVTVFDEETKVIPLKSGRGIDSGLATIREAEKSASEVQSSFSTPETGGDKTAFQVSREETNARIQLGAFGKMIGTATRDLTYLMLDDIVNHQTTPMLDEVLDPDLGLKYKTFLLADQTEGGKKVTKKIKFTDKFLGIEKDEEDMLNRSFKLLDEEGIDGEVRIFELNPIQASKLRFKVSVNPDNLLIQSEAFEKALKLDARDRMITSPLADIEAVERDFLFDVFAPGESDKYMKSLKDVLGQAPKEASPVPEKPKSDLVSQITGGDDLASLIRT